MSNRNKGKYVKVDLTTDSDIIADCTIEGYHWMGSVPKKIFKLAIVLQQKNQ